VTAAVPPGSGPGAGQVPPPVKFEDVPAVYARWNRADYPDMTDGAIAERWRWRTDAERKFWLDLAVGHLALAALREMRENGDEAASEALADIEAGR